MSALAVACFGVLGALAAPSESSGGYIAALAVAGAGIGLAVIALLGGGLQRLNPSVVSSRGAGAIAAAVGHGFALLVPFTVMAAIAQLGLEWNATVVFTSAGILTSGSAAGAEVARLGGRKLASVIVPVLIGMAAVTLWSLGLAVAPEVISGAGG